MIDLHLHTTASDGWLSPAQLVARAVSSGLTIISVTDHDTTASLTEAAALTGAAGLRFVPGIEITAVHDRRDVHVLGYFFDPDSTVLSHFLAEQRRQRRERTQEIGARLAALGVPVEIGELATEAADRPGRSVGRPQVARALVKAGHVRSIQEAFDRFLATGRPAFVPRRGPAPHDVVTLLHEVGGIASMAHPAVTKWDEGIVPLAAAGLDAIEAYHSDHTPLDVQRYLATAARLRLATSGGSDFHGADPRATAPLAAFHGGTIGAVSLPQPAFEELEGRARARRGAS